MKQPAIQLLLVLLLKIYIGDAFAPTHNTLITTRSLTSPLHHQAIILPANPCTSTALFDSSSNDKEPNLSIEYCTGCRWMFRASWLMQECLTTFNDEIGSVTLVPSKPPSPGGTFLIKLNNDVIWDRKLEGSFPEAKQLKQRIRDRISPEKDLGHSDVVKNEAVEDSSASNSSNSEVDGHCQECEDVEKDAQNSISDNDNESVLESKSPLNNINITYCTGSQWMMRATWTCQELLSTFQEELYSVSLTPSRPPEEVGQYIIFLNSETIWDHKAKKEILEANELKRLVMDMIAPGKNVGLANSQGTNESGDDDPIEVDLDDDNAAEMRSFYGVL